MGGPAFANINKSIPIIRGVKVIYFEAELLLLLLLHQVLILTFLSVVVSLCVMDDMHASKTAWVLLDVSEGWCILQKVMTSGLEVTDPQTSCPHNNCSFPLSVDQSWSNTPFPNVCSSFPFLRSKLVTMW